MKKSFLKIAIVGVMVAIEAASANANNSNIANISYKAGYKAGYKGGYKKGIVQARKEYKKALTLVNKKIKAMGGGLYLASRGKITAPMIYQIKEGGKTVVKNGGCSILKELNPQEIALLPMFSQEDIDTNNKIEEAGGINNYYSAFSDFKNGFGNAKDVSDDSVLVLVNTQKYIDLLGKTQYNYSVKGDSIVVVFDNFNDKVTFVKKYNIPNNDF